jgi:predicted PurR-regulated permease PerM
VAARTDLAAGMQEKLRADASQEAIEDIHADAAEHVGVSEETAFGRPGPPFHRRAPFMIGFTGALGVACAFAIAWTVVVAGQVLVLLGLAFFIAVGLEPAVVWLYRRGLPRLAAVGGFLALAIPVVTTQATTLAGEIPHYLHTLGNHSTTLGRLNAKWHFVAGVQKLLNGHVSFSSAVGIGKALLGFLTSAVVVIVVAIYLLADMPRVRRGLYLLAPRSRRPRMVLLTDEILDRVGGYVLGNLLTSLIAGIGTTVWALALGIPYALLLGLLVAVLDLIPIIGSTIGGIVVSLVALTISLGVALATAVFYVVYRLL